MHDLGTYLSVQPLGALATVLATVVLYLAFTGVLRFWGQRILASPSSFDLALVTVLGAIVGRATMGRNPTLVAALLALGTLLVCHHVAGLVRRPVAQDRAVAVVVAGQPDQALLERYRIDDRSLWSALRAAGISSTDEVALMVLEPHGQFSVLRSDSPVHESALTGVRHASEVRQRLAAAGLTVGEDQPRNDTSG